GWATLATLGWLLYLYVRLLVATYDTPFLLPDSRRQQQIYRRKQLAALLSVRYGLGPGGPALVLAADHQFGLLVRRFLADHRIPYALSLYDQAGRYQFASPEKVQVLSRALLQAVGKGHDNELYVLLADLLELGEHLGPLQRAVRVALARHHHVV